MEAEILREIWRYFTGNGKEDRDVKSGDHKAEKSACKTGLAGVRLATVLAVPQLQCTFEILLFVDAGILGFFKVLRMATKKHNFRSVAKCVIFNIRFSNQTLQNCCQDYYWNCGRGDEAKCESLAVRFLEYYEYSYQEGKIDCTCIS
ncbi:unnamed protein product [Cylicocyclus nassatus]|uniref:Uncharacterized protein n=1 Tax=Cylicocyclus nassatus TaxID=53992 RepID=A0AA36H7B3_CYLNA|nr:unnamed protein product [Cylicocyclus nassatus]